MRRLKQQDGMAMIGWILLIGLIITISVLALKILPMYRYSFSDSLRTERPQSRPNITNQESNARRNKKNTVHRI